MSSQETPVASSSTSACPSAKATPSPPHSRPKLHEAPSTASLTVTHHRTPHPWFTPTHLYLAPTHGDQAVWNARAARKGRYSRKRRHIHDHSSSTSPATPDAEGGAGGGRHEGVYLRIKDMESDLKPHLKMDISFWVAVAFTFGSAVWVVNGFLAWFPFFYPSLDAPAPAKTASAMAFIGGTVFVIGSYLMVVEALDRGRETNFGTALGKLLHRRRVTKAIHQVEKEVRKAESHIAPAPTQAGGSNSTLSERSHEDDMVDKDRSFVWWGKPMWHDLGYLAALVQLFAASIFWVATVTGLPGVIPGYFDGGGSLAIIDVFFWTPQVVGGTGFIISSLLLMVEVQDKWWKPKLSDLGWWIGVWNLIGALGFMLCGAFGYSGDEGITYESDLATWWGSWAFLFGSFCQCWEVIWREPADDNAAKSGEADEKPSNRS